MPVHDNVWCSLQNSARQHIVALYWSITTFTTVGFGDIHPVNEAEQIYSMIVLVRGCCCCLAVLTVFACEILERRCLMLMVTLNPNIFFFKYRCSTSVSGRTLYLAC